MSHIARHHLPAALLGAATAVLPLQASHADYPEQLIKIIVTFPPGGAPTSSSARWSPLLPPISGRGL